jgi:NAD(P)-dependent dehydrogenase (short-subunit alcohol dehydrogenase family)
MGERSEAGRVVLLTGAAGGIGAAMAEALLGAGHAVAAVDRDEAGLRRLGERHAAAGDRLHPITAELGVEAGCRFAVEEAARRFGRVDAVVNNAGIGVSSLRRDAEKRCPAIDELTAETWDRFFAVNVRAPMLLIQAALPMMRRQGWGRIVNNTTSYLTMHRVLPYGASKAALESASAIWAKELAGTGITVNVLIPGGPTDTPFVGDIGLAREAMLRPAIMGKPLAWLVSAEAGSFTGQRIIAARWDAALAPAAAAQAAARPIGWPELAADAVWPGAMP